MSSQQSKSGSGSVRRVVVVEDHPELRQMLAELLSTCGHDVQVAATGHEALAVIAQSAPDVALVDIGLPDLDGFEVARRIRGSAAGQGLQLVALTGHADVKDRGTAMAAGFDDFLVKPVDVTRLLDLLAR